MPLQAFSLCAWSLDMSCKRWSMRGKLSQPRACAPCLGRLPVSSRVPASLGLLCISLTLLIACQVQFSWCLMSSKLTLSDWPGQLGSYSRMSFRLAGWSERVSAPCHICIFLVQRRKLRSPGSVSLHGSLEQLRSLAWSLVTWKPPEGSRILGS